MKPLAVLTVLLASLLAGCASLNKDQCITADWHTIGYEDGANGLADTRIGSHREACAKHGVTPNLQQYRDGHSEGLKSFCKPRNGFNRARSGYQYKGICPASLEPDFLAGYEAGQQIYQAESDINDLEGLLHNNEAEQQEIEQQLHDKEAVLLSSRTPEQRRRVVYQDIAQLKKRQGSLEQQRDDLIRDLANSESWLHELRNRYSYY